MLTMRLEANNYQVSVANNGTEGLAKAEAENPSLILLDVMMPGLDGFEVLRRLKRSQATKYIPVVMLTARGESKSIFDAQKLGADDYLIKTCTSQDLLDVVHRFT
jgi:two-component system phosphate regulon response regulator PhoB